MASEGSQNRASTDTRLTKHDLFGSCLHKAAQHRHFFSSPHLQFFPLHFSLNPVLKYDT